MEFVLELAQAKVQRLIGGEKENDSDEKDYLNTSSRRGKGDRVLERKGKEEKGRRMVHGGFGEVFLLDGDDSMEVGESGNREQRQIQRHSKRLNMDTVTVCTLYQVFRCYSFIYFGLQILFFFNLGLERDSSITPCPVTYYVTRNPRPHCHLLLDALLSILTAFNLLPASSSTIKVLQNTHRHASLLRTSISQIGQIPSSLGDIDAIPDGSSSPPCDDAVTTLLLSRSDESGQLKTS